MKSFSQELMSEVIKRIIDANNEALIRECYPKEEILILKRIEPDTRMKKEKLIR